MRRFIPFSIVLGLLLVPQVFAQDVSAAWQNNDSRCDPAVLADTMRASQAAQDKAAADAAAVNDYLKSIKNAPTNSSGQMLSCVDMSWPYLPFSGTFPQVQEYIKTVAQKAVSTACNEARQRVQKVDSVFNTSNLKAPSLGDYIPSANSLGSSIGQTVGGSLPNVPNVSGGSVLPSAPSGSLDSLLTPRKPPIKIPPSQL